MIARLSKAAKMCGINRTTLWRWRLNDARIARCEFKPGWFIVERLAELGLCPKPPEGIGPSEPLAKQRRKAGAA